MKFINLEVAALMVLMGGYAAESDANASPNDLTKRQWFRPGGGMQMMSPGGQQSRFPGQGGMWQSGGRQPGGGMFQIGGQQPGGSMWQSGGRQPGSSMWQSGGRQPGGGMFQVGGHQPEGGMFPGGSQRPEGDMSPGGGQQPGGGMFPGGGQQPGGSQQPGGGQQPGQDTSPEGGQQPGGSMFPDGGQQPGGGQQSGGGDKPSASGPSSGSCANYSSEPGMNIQKMLELVNKARGNLTPLKLNDSLMKASVWQSTNQKNMNQVSHDSPDGKSFMTRARECGYPVASVSENAAQGNSEEMVMQQWMSSAPHKRNIMGAQYKEFGCAKVGNYWTQMFGS